jgi:hypothetical protein
MGTRAFISPAPIKQSNLIGDFSIKQFICDSRILQINNRFLRVSIEGMKGKWLSQTAFKTVLIDPIWL